MPTPGRPRRAPQRPVDRRALNRPNVQAQPAAQGPQTPSGSPSPPKSWRRLGRAGEAREVSSCEAGLVLSRSYFFPESSLLGRALKAKGIEPHIGSAVQKGNLSGKIRQSDVAAPPKLRGDQA